MEAILHDFDDQQLQSLASSTPIGNEQWRQYRLICQRRKQLLLGEDNASDVASEAGDIAEREELAALKRRAEESGLDATAADRYQTLPTSTLENPTAKRTRRAEAQSHEMYRAFCTAAAQHMVPGAAADPAPHLG